jgi:hypothetical protein
MKQSPSIYRLGDLCRGSILGAPRARDWDTWTRPWGWAPFNPNLTDLEVGGVLIYTRWSEQRGNARLQHHGVHPGQTRMGHGATLRQAHPNQ